MKPHDDKIEQYRDLDPKQYRVLHSFSFQQSRSYSGEYDKRIVVVAGRAIHQDSAKIRVTFSGVKHCKFRQSDWSEMAIGYIQILTKEDLPDLQENFYVRDPEQDSVLRFECADFDFEVIEEGKTSLGT